LFGLIVIGLIIPLLPVKAVSSTPNAPSGLYKSSSTATSITINWTDNSSNETGFRIYRNGSLYDLVGANTTSYTDTGLACGTTYSYYVTAINSVSAPPPPRSGSTSYSASNTNSCTQNYSSYSLSLAAGETLNIGTCGVAGSSGSGDTYLRLYLGGSEVASNDDACGVLSNISYTASSAGTYVLRMGCYSSGSCSGTVAYTINSLALKTPWSPVAKVFNWFNRELGLVKTAAAQTVYESTASNTISASTAACPDTTPPTNPTSLSASGSPCSGSNPLACSSTAPSLTYSWNAGTDAGSGIAGYQVVLQDSTTAAWVASATVGNVLSASLFPSGLVNNRTYYTWVRAYDNAGNWNGVFLMGNSVVPQNETTPPTGSVNPVSGTSYSAYSYNVTASYTDASGVASITYCTVDGTSNCSPSITSATSSVVVTIASPIITFCHFGTDTLGNSSAVACGTYYLRPTQPNSIALSTNQNNGNVTIGWWDTATSESSFGIARTGPSNTIFSAPAKSGTGWTSYTDVSCPTGGTYTYAVSACNAAGCSNAISDSIIKPSCDTTPPSGTVNFNPSVNYTSASSSGVDLGCSDVGGSGCSTYKLYGPNDSSCSSSLITSGSYSGPVSTTINLGGQGAKAISAKFTDVAGNSSCVSQSIYVDTTPPTGSVSINNDATTTSSANVTLTLTCSDNTDPDLRVLAPPSNKFAFVSKILHWLGLNWIAEAFIGPTGKGGCQSYNVYTSGNCSGSAVSNGTAPQSSNSITASATLSSGSGTKYISVQYMDGAGNTYCASDSIVLDTTPPTCSVAASGSTLTATCSDTGGSGCTQATKTQTATTTGTYTFNFSDNAGNSGSCSYPYTAVQLPTACTSVGVTSIVSGSGATNVTPVTFQCYGSSGGSPNEYLHTYYLNGSSPVVVGNQPSYLNLTLGQGTYADCIQAHNSAGYSGTTCGSMVVDTQGPIPDAAVTEVGSKEYSLTPTSIFTNIKGSRYAKGTTSTNANDPAFSLTLPVTSLSGLKTATCVLNKGATQVGASVGCRNSNNQISVSFTPYSYTTGTNNNDNNGDYSIVVSAADNAGNIKNNFYTSSVLNVNNLKPSITNVR